MPQIYTADHPYFSPGDLSKYGSSPSFSHQLIFGNSVEESFPHFVVIKTAHVSHWNWYDSSYFNKQTEKMVKDDWIVNLGNKLRAVITDDVFISNKAAEYFFETRQENSSFPIFEKQYFNTDEDGDLIRLPTNCHIHFTIVRFRQLSDKETFMNINALMDDEKFKFDEELFEHYNIKYGTRDRDAGRDILCPCCKVNFNEQKYNNSKIGTTG